MTDLLQTHWSRFPMIQGGFQKSPRIKSQGNGSCYHLPHGVVWVAYQVYVQSFIMHGHRGHVIDVHLSLLLSFLYFKSDLLKNPIFKQSSKFWFSNTFESLQFSIFRFIRFQNLIFHQIWPPFSFRRATLEFFMILKCFKINMNLNSVIPNNGIYGINSCKNKLGFGGGPTWNKIFFKIRMNFEWSVIRAIVGSLSCLVIWMIYFMFVTMH